MRDGKVKVKVKVKWHSVWGVECGGCGMRERHA